MNASWCYCNVLPGWMWANAFVWPLSGMVEMSSFWVNTDLKWFRDWGYGLGLC